VSQLAVMASAAPVGINQDYLLQARQMQALSFAVHIPLVCFGIAFPALVLFVEWLYLRTGDELYRTLAKRWTKVMAALFAAGVVTGTILSFEMGLLWPSFTASFGSVFGLGFALEGFSFFMEAIFIGIYIYGWSRLSPRAHFASGIPVAIAGITGSLTVISVNGWMNHPTGFHVRDGKAVDVRPLDALFGNSYFWRVYAASAAANSKRKRTGGLGKLERRCEQDG
jgi:cytochrome d ubiquinol oxidase subunit I